MTEQSTFEALRQQANSGLVVPPDARAPRPEGMLLQMRQDEANPNANALYLTPTTPDYPPRVFFGSQTHVIGSLNLRYVSGIDYMPIFNTKQFLTIGHLGSSHALDRAQNNVVYNASGPDAAHKFFSGPEYSGVDGTTLSLSVSWRGLRLATYTTAARNALVMQPEDAGRLLFNASTGKVNLYNGSGWEAFVTEPA